MTNESYPIDGEISHPKTGLWLDPHFPKEGWTITGEGWDRGPDDLLPCEVCKVTPVRYPLMITHPHWFDTLQSGCVCCAILTGDKEGTTIARNKAVALAKKQPGYKARAYKRRPPVEAF